MANPGQVRRDEVQLSSASQLVAWNKLSASGSLWEYQHWIPSTPRDLLSLFYVLFWSEYLHQRQKQQPWRQTEGTGTHSVLAFIWALLWHRLWPCSDSAETTNSRTNFSVVFLPLPRLNSPYYYYYHCYCCCCCCSLRQYFKLWWPRLQNRRSLIQRHCVSTFDALTAAG